MRVIDTISVPKSVPRKRVFDDLDRGRSVARRPRCQRLDGVRSTFCPPSYEYGSFCADDRKGRKGGRLEYRVRRNGKVVLPVAGLLRSSLLEILHHGVEVLVDEALDLPVVLKARRNHRCVRDGLQQQP